MAVDYDAARMVADELLLERLRQVEAEGFSYAHDDEHDDGELAAAAASYALSGVELDIYTGVENRLWPFDYGWLKRGTPRQNLIKAGGLIIAEIERLDRAKARSAMPEPQNGGGDFYVLKMTNTLNRGEFGVPNAFCLVGPFRTDDAAADWGRDERYNPNDNPCWQVVQLTDPTEHGKVISPADFVPPPAG